MLLYAYLSSYNSLFLEIFVGYLFPAYLPSIQVLSKLGYQDSGNRNNGMNVLSVYDTMPEAYLSLLCIFGILSLSPTVHLFP